MFRRFHNIYFALLAVTVLMMVTACGGDDDDGPNLLPNSQQPSQQGNGLEPDEKIIAARIEVPALKPDNKFIYHSTKEGGRNVMNYCVDFDLQKRHSRWVAFRFDGDTRGRTTSRSNEPFTDDPELPSTAWVGSYGFGSPFNRGHLCASYDRLYSEEANEQTFYMSNISPQENSLNQGYWITLENLVAKCGRDVSFADTLYVVKGGAIDKPEHIRGYLSRTSGQMAIPKYYFMALLRVKSRSYTSIAFWVENKRYGYNYDNPAPRSEIAKNALSVDKLETLTGIDFFHNLPDNIENQVEATFNFNDWNK